MKVLIAGLQGGANGVETYTRHLAGGLRDHGHDVLLARLPHVEGRPAYAAELLLPERAWKTRRVTGPFESIRSHAVIRRAADELGCDVVHATYAEFVPRKLSAPAVAVAWHPVPRVVERVRTAPSRRASRLSELMFGLNDHLAFGAADTVVAVSAAARDAVAEIAPTKVVLQPPFVSDIAINAEPRHPRQQVVVIASVLDTPAKRVQLAIDAVGVLARRSPSVELLLIGEWSSRAPTLPEYCRSVGFQPPEVVARILSESAALVVPSVFEEFGFVGLEALAAGCPVVCAP